MIYYDFGLPYERSHLIQPWGCNNSDCVKNTHPWGVRFTEAHNDGDFTTSVCHSCNQSSVFLYHDRLYYLAGTLLKTIEGISVCLWMDSATVYTDDAEPQNMSLDDATALYQKLLLLT